MSTSLSNLVDNLSGVYDKECKNCMERKKLGWIVNLFDLRMVDWIINVKSVKNHALSYHKNHLKIFQLCMNFAMVISISFFCY